MNKALSVVTRDSDEYAEILRQNHRQVFGLIRSMIPDVSDDEIQTLYLYLLQTHKNYDPSLNIKIGTYIANTVKLRILKIRKREHRHINMLREYDEKSSSNDSILNILSLNELMERINNEPDPRLKTILEMFFLHNKTLTDIAYEVGITAEWVRKQKNRWVELNAARFAV